MHSSPRRAHGQEEAAELTDEGPAGRRACFTNTHHPKIATVVNLRSPPPMKRSLQGRYLKVATAGEPFKAFVPAPLPPRPAIDWTPALRGRFDAALVALGRLDAVTDLLPNAALLLYSFVRKEAVLSSMIEGTQPRSRT